MNDAHAPQYISSENILFSTASLLDGAKPLPENFSNESKKYYGEIILHDNSIKKAYIKDITTKELLNELLSYCIAKILHCPVADSFLVYCKNGSIPIYHAPAMAGGHVLFASEDQSLDSLKYLINSLDDAAVEEAIKLLASNENIDAVYALDILIANTDRNMGNILFGKNDFVLIDHARTFGLPQCKNFNDLVFHAKYECLIEEWLTPRIDSEQRNSILNRIENRIPKIRKGLLESILYNSYIRNNTSDRERSSVFEFLWRRKSMLRTLSADSLGII